MEEPKDQGKKLKEMSAVDILAFVKEVSGHAEKEISRVAMLYKVVAGCLTLIVVAGIGFTFKDASEFRKNAREEIAEQKKLIKDDIREQETRMRERQEALFSQMQLLLSSQVAALGKKVESKVDEEFKTENITKLVNDKAQARIDTIADPIITDKIAKKIQPTIDGVNKNVEQIKTDIETSRKKINNLEQVSEFVNVVTNAKNDDRKAFDQLGKWESDPTFYRQNDAYHARKMIIEDYANTPDFNHSVRWNDNIDPSKLSFSVLRDDFYRMESIDQKTGLLQYIWDSKDFSKKQRMGLMIEAMKNDNSLTVVCKASRLFQNEAMKNIKCLYTFLLIDWWDKNKDSISDKPENK